MFVLLFGWHVVFDELICKCSCCLFGRRVVFDELMLLVVVLCRAYYVVWVCFDAAFRVFFIY